MDSCEVNSWATAALAGWAILEFWLGKTNWVESGSTLELILNMLKSFIKLIPR